MVKNSLRKYSKKIGKGLAGVGGLAALLFTGKYLYDNYKGKNQGSEVKSDRSESGFTLDEKNKVFLEHLNNIYNHFNDFFIKGIGIYPDIVLIKKDIYVIDKDVKKIISSKEFTLFQKENKLGSIKTNKKGFSKNNLHGLLVLYNWKTIKNFIYSRNKDKYLKMLEKNLIVN